MIKKDNIIKYRFCFNRTILYVLSIVMTIAFVSSAVGKDIRSKVGYASMESSRPSLAGSTVPLKFKFVIGEKGLHKGGRLALNFDGLLLSKRYIFNNITVSSDAGEVKFEVAWDRTDPERKLILLAATLTQVKPVSAGTEVTISSDVTYPNTSNAILRLTPMIAYKSNSELVPLKEQFTLRPRWLTASKIYCSAEARPLKDQPSRVIISILDRYFSPIEDFVGTVSIKANTKTNLPTHYTFTAADLGSHEFIARFPSDKVSRIVVTSGNLSAKSNPIYPRESDEPAIFFGDIHVHCNASSDAIGDPDYGYHYARDVLGLDFAAFSDHTPQGQYFQSVRKANQLNYKPGRFVTLLSWEWSDYGHGHRNIYYPDNAGPEYGANLNDNMKSWWDYLDQKNIQALIIPHHMNAVSHGKLKDINAPGWGPLDWSQVNNKYQRVAEICQDRGSFELPGGINEQMRIKFDDYGSSVQTALAKGHRLGFIGSTDMHFGLPGVGMGLCAVLSNELNRRSVWQAMYDRSCYATTGDRILLFFTLNGSQMGSELIQKKSTESRIIQWRAIGTDAIKRVDLIRNNIIVQSWPGENQDDMSGQFALDRPCEETEWWYLRVLQTNKEIAWSSPIWIDPPGKL